MDSDDARTLPYGTWPSPVAPSALTSAVQLSLPRIDGADTYWLEGRPEEGGRTAVVRRDGEGASGDVPVRLPGGEPVDVRTRVHEYGGGAYTVRAGVLVLSHGVDGRLYRVERDGAARPLTPAGPWRYADPVIDAGRGLVHTVREDHGENATAHGEPVNELVAVPLDGSAADTPDRVRTLVTGHDFVSSPTLSEDGARLAFVTWEHPHLPWTSSLLHVADLDDAGAVRRDRVLAGGDGVSVVQPVWTAGGDLVHVDNSTGWWNLYRTEAGAVSGDGGHRHRALHPAEAEFAPPPWRLGTRTVAVLDEDHLVCTWSTAGRWHLGTVRLANGELEEWHAGWQPVGELAAGEGRVVALAASATHPPAVVEVDLTAHDVHVLRTAAEVALDPADVSVAQELSWPSADGEPAHGFFYPPTSARTTGPEGEAPPLVVMVHGGPTSATHAVLTPAVQFWTTRGIAVLDVNYGGSTGYGRTYRERLDGAWGVVDVADCAAGALHLAEAGLVDGRRMAIRGGSAGGFTTLAALASTEVFTCGTSLFGIGDLEALARETHKFESHLTDWLVGPYPASRERYRERSPVHHVEQVGAPVLLLQGTEDRVVPPGQAEHMAAALRARGLPVAMIMFDGEAHGFRRAGTIETAALAELSFYAQVWGFTPAGEVPRVAVENL